MLPRSLPISRVLLVDDDELVLSVLHTVLVRAGFSVRDALNSADALRMLAIHPVEVVVLDAHIPGSTLESDLAAIASLAEAPNIVVLSGTDIDAQLLVGVGASYLAKPVDAKVFVEHIGAAMATR